MKIMVVDDEALALRSMERCLSDHMLPGVEIESVSYHQNPMAALAVAEQMEGLDVAFLDIKLPEMNGLELAKRLTALHSNVQIVFVTAYDHHALKAFELQALDYVLKPVKADRILKTLERAEKIRVMMSEPHEQHIMIGCFGHIHYNAADETGKTFPWKTLKAQELFAFLLHHREKLVERQVIIDLFWPEDELDKALMQLHTAIYQIRKMMKDQHVGIEIKYHAGGYRLHMHGVLLDTEIWESQLKQAPELNGDTLEMHLELIRQYSGDYLEEHPYMWAEHERERLRMIWFDKVKLLAEHCLSLDMFSDAITLYREMQEKFPYLEEGYLGLMRVYAKMNDSAEVKKQYVYLTHMMKEELGIEPSEKAEDWYEQWKNREYDRDVRLVSE